MKMTIAHCRTQFLPHTETFIENQIRNLEEFDSIVLTREILERFKNSDNDFKVFANKNNNLKWIFKQISKKEKEFFTNVIFEKNIKLLHAHFGLDAWYFLSLKKETGLPLIVSFYGYDAYRLPKRFFGIGRAVILKAVFRNADAVVVPSEHMKKHLIGLGCSDDKVEVLPWGVDISHHVETLQCIVSTGRNNKTRFISIGRMVEKKGQVYLLDAFKKVLDRGIDADLTIIGSGPLKKKISKTLDKLGICGKVRVLDKMSNHAVIRELVSHNIYVQPSIEARNGDQEGIPTAIMEALYCGMPVIAATHSGIPEIIENNVSGILVPERDSEQLADAMEKLAKDTVLRIKFGENGRKTIEERFNAKKQIKKLEEVYKKAIKSKVKSPI